MSEIKEGLILVDKPVGITSFGVISRLRRASGIRRIGHAGTLDPMTSGLLICLVGREFTRQADTFLKQDKVYQVELELGKVSSTGDREGEITQISTKAPKKAEITVILHQFIGEISQTPPDYSAIKINGVRAYKLAREGKSIDMKARNIQIYSITKIMYSYPKLSFTTKVSSGTYIRSLGADIGEKLGTGAYLMSLRRTKIGIYRVEDAIALENVS